MTWEELQAFLHSMDDAEVSARLTKALEDLEAAAREVPDSEWHEACFSAVAIFSQEHAKRHPPVLH